MIYEQTLTAVYQQLQQTMTQMNEMHNAVTSAFAEIPIAELRKVVQSIPQQIRTFADELSKTQGIIVKDSDLKLTPAFIKSLSNSNPSLGKTMSVQSLPALTESEQQQEEEPPRRRASRSNRESFVSFGGLPMETVLPLIQSLNARRAGVDEKAARRFTLW
jgi:hypothetical protein